MALIKPTGTDERFLMRTRTLADETMLTNVQLYEKFAGSDGTGNTLFTLANPYLVGTNTLWVFLNGQRLTVSDDYAETNSFQITLVSAAADTDVIEIFVVGAYNVREADISSSLLSLPGSKNFFINPQLIHWQRGISFAATAYAADRFLFQVSGGSTTTFIQATGITPPGWSETTFAGLVTIAGQSGAGDYAQLRSQIEDITRFSGRTLTISCDVYSNIVGNIALRATSDYGSGGSSAETNVIQKKPVVVGWNHLVWTFDVGSASGKTLGADNCLELTFLVSAGTTYDAISDTLGIQNGAWYFTNMAVYHGPYDHPFIPPDPAADLVLCQRYFESSYDSVAPGTVTNVGCFSFREVSVGATYIQLGRKFRVIKRANPTVTLYSVNSGTADRIFDANATADYTAGTSFLYKSSKGFAAFNVGTSPPVGNTLYWHETVSAEL